MTIDLPHVQHIVRVQLDDGRGVAVKGAIISCPAHEEGTYACTMKVVLYDMVMLCTLSLQLVLYDMVMLCTLSLQLVLYDMGMLCTLSLQLVLYDMVMLCTLSLASVI